MLVSGRSTSKPSNRTRKTYSSKRQVTFVEYACASVNANEIKHIKSLTLHKINMKKSSKFEGRGFDFRLRRGFFPSISLLHLIFVSSFIPLGWLVGLIFKVGVN